MDLYIRTVEPQDSTMLSILCNQLGYEMSESDILSHINTVSSSTDHRVLVAVDDDYVVGFLHASVGFWIESKPFIEIGGLVVDKNYRGKGVGKLLVAEIRKWCEEKQIKTLRVRTNTIRKEAHRFYETIGFTEVKQQKVYEIIL